MTKLQTIIASSISLLVVAFVAGNFIGSRAAPDDAPAVATDPSIERYRIPLGRAPHKGADAAKVTIVEYSDFQCPFCSRAEATLDQIMKTYGPDVELVWKNCPLPFHQNATPAAALALAAAEHGQFWPMHDLLFRNQQALDHASLVRYGHQLGLDDQIIGDALDRGRYARAIKADADEAAHFGVRGTPAFFINGRPLSGAQPFTAFKKVIDEELAAANRALHSGVALAQLYDAITKNGKAEAAHPAARRRGPAMPPPDDKTVYKAELGDAPVRGAKAAKVTIVEWADYQCPFCGRVQPTLAKVMETYKDDVRFAFKQLPLPFHNHAHLAAEAALAAKAQGKFWQMHDKLYANQQALDRAALDTYARALKLNMKKFDADLDHGTWAKKVDAEAAEGNRLGARGTPAFFINGKSLVGAQPFEAFKAKIDAELKNADALAQKGVKVARLYDTIMKTAKAEAPLPTMANGPAADKAVYHVEAGAAPAVGPRSAPVTIVEFSDFQCPFCGRVEATIKQIEEKYRGKVRFAFRNYPLPFHQHAQLAAEAAMAAAAQGKFWQMHDKLFANQQALDRASLEKYAADIGLDVARFRADLDSGNLAAAVQRDVAYANTVVGHMGTPTFFINGHKLSGAQPFDSFAHVIDQELAHTARPQHAELMRRKKATL